MEASFTTFDKNEDDKLDIDEFKGVCQSLFRNDKAKLYNLENTKLQEIFDIFDKNADGFIDKEEFIFCWENWMKVIVTPISSFVIVDVQNDFVEGTASISKCPAGQNGQEVIEPINQLLKTVHFESVFYSLDWHPDTHISFIESFRRKELHRSSPVKAGEAKVYDTVIFDGTPPIKQKLWPRHCIQYTWGAELHKGLRIPDNANKILKGTNLDADSYSVFWVDNKLTPTNLDADLKSKNITDVFVCGIAYDICVGGTVLDALAAGYRTILIDDCSKGVDLDEIEEMKSAIIKNGGIIVKSSEVKAMVEGKDRRPELGYKLALELKSTITV